MNEEQTLKDLHRLLLETQVIEGKLVCGNCGHQYVIKEGIANFLLPSHLGMSFFPFLCLTSIIGFGYEAVSNISSNSLKRGFGPCQCFYFDLYLWTPYFCHVRYTTVNSIPIQCHWPHSYQCSDEAANREKLPRVQLNIHHSEDARKGRRK